MRVNGLEFECLGNMQSIYLFLRLLDPQRKAESGREKERGRVEEEWHRSPRRACISV